MNLEHLRAFLWLRWRLALRQVLRGGVFNTILFFGMVSGSVLLMVGSSVIAFLLGCFAFEEVTPAIMMYAWDGIVVVFLFLWLIGLMSELQRTEAWSIDKFLHLPVSISSLFLLNYLSSLPSSTLILFAPMMVGLNLGLIVSRGPLFLLGIPLTLAFFLMVTALTYQFQGWLASLMVDKRRRRTVIAITTIVFLLLFQAPNLINVFRPWEVDDQRNRDGQAQLTARSAEWAQALNAGEITNEEYNRRVTELVRAQAEERKQRNARILGLAEQGAWIANVALPIGWLPLGLGSLVQADVTPPLLGTFGLAAIGALSLWRAYRTTLRLYTGDFTARQTIVPAPAPTPVTAAPHPPRVLEGRIPCLSEQATAIALAGFRSLSRAPEAKLLLLMPIIMVFILGGMYLRGLSELPDFTLPFVAFGVMYMIVLSLTQMVGNQFGFDRTGFRAYVLSPVPRRDLLLGKNLAIAPVPLTLCIVSVSIFQLIYPMRVDRYLALLPQAVSMFLILCMLANWLSIFAPSPIPTGALKPANTNWAVVLYNMQFLCALTPALATTLVPIGIELGLEALGWVEGAPIALPLSVLECGGMVVVYRAMLSWQGQVLQGREQRILEIVTTQAE